MEHSSLLSVCIPVYKRVEFLIKLVEKIPSTYDVNISDNGGFLIQADKIKASNIRISPSSSVLTMFENWNRAADLVTSDWFIIPGDDDIVFGDKLPQVERYIEKYPDAGIIVFGHELIDGDGKVKGEWCPSEELYLSQPHGFRPFSRGVPARWPSIVFNSKKFRETGGFDTSFKNTASDSLLMQSMSLRFPVAFIPEIMGQYRVWEDSGTSKQIMTNEWFEQIDMWIEKLGKEISANAAASKLYDMDKIQTDIVFSNQMFALSRMNKSGIGRAEKRSFINGLSRPRKLSWIDRLRLLRALYM